ncbi:MAG TPA: M48 family metalloprotease [Xanthomonadaceae bacterium]|nr:M48 family metalloprotease [Xanthomonadaceae bacterium]
MLRHAPLATLLTLALGCATPAFALNDSPLPDIGSTAGQVLSPEQQHEYGELTFRELRREGYVLDDPLLEDWLQGIGEHLAANSSRPSQDFHFFVVNSREINAFATLGGYVAVNAGLILTTASEDELAAVMSHEISHVTQNHVLRGIESEKKDTVPIILGMIAAAIVASRSGSGSSTNGGEAAIASGFGLMAQQEINFTRGDEAEADHFGIQTMARAGYDPLAMASFFDRMQAANRSNEGYGPYQVPDFLQDHPVDSVRISDALARARQIKSKPDTVLTGGIATAPDSLLLPADITAHHVSAVVQHGRDFGWARERLRVLSAETSSVAIGEYRKIRDAHPGAFGDAQRYGLAIALLQNGESAAALTELQGLSQRHPDAYWIDLAIAKAQFLSGHRQTALESYDRLLQRMPGNRGVILTYATTLGEMGTAEAGRRAQAVLRPLMADGGDDPDFQQVYARASELAGDTGRASESYAMVAYLNGRAEDALNQLEALKRRDDIDYYQRARVEARIAELTPVVLEMHKRGVHAGDVDKQQQQLAPQAALRKTQPQLP